MRMKRMVTLLCSGLFFAGCLTDPAGEKQTVDATPFATAKSLSVEREISPVSSELLAAQAASNNRFAVAMYRQMTEADKNLFFSPYSISAALGMTSAGARGRTEQQIRSALQVTLEGDDFHAALNGLDKTLMDHAGATDGLTLNIVNSTWVQSNWDFRVSFLDKLSRYYGAGVNLLDFTAKPEESRVIINTWVSDQTNRKIEDLIPQGSITPDTRLVLTNAIYFLGSWLYRFDKSLTRDQEFHLLDNTTVTVPLMQLGAEGEVTMRYARDRNASVRAVDLPYKGDRLAMTVILPDRGAFSEYESGLSAEGIEGLLQKLDSTDLPPVRLPRFTFTSPSVSLAAALKSLGMTDAFNAAKADFSGIDGKRDLVVSDVVHKAFIAVDEEGTEAAAATAVIIKLTSVDPDPPRFVADRPFLFLIRDRLTNTILFMGKIVDPTKSR